MAGPGAILALLLVALFVIPALPGAAAGAPSHPREASPPLLVPGVSHGQSPSSARHLSASPPHEGVRTAAPRGGWVPLPSYIWMVQLQFYNTSGAPYAQSDFDRIAANQYNTIELILPWTLETSRGVYDFSQLDTYMTEASNDGLAVVVVFWYWGWTFGVSNWVPSWIPARELYSNGASAAYPPWWNVGARADYFSFVNATVSHLDPVGNFQGVYAPFGWLDYPFSPPPSGASGAVVAGYSADTTAAYDWYLESQYSSLAAYNSVYGTSYTSWSQVPASPPGSPEWNDFGNFRIFSVQQTFTQLSQYVRAITNRTLFYYYGGDISGAVVGVNLEDFYFQLAARYGGIVNVDDADWPALVATFGSLASRYHVPFIQEFTPPGAGFQGGFDETMANMYIGRPWEVGADFFTYNPPDPNFSWAFALFGSLHQVTEARAPSQTARNGVAALVSYFSGFYSFANTGAATNSLPSQQGLLLQLEYSQRPFEVVTDLELMDGAVNLTQFSSVLDLGNAYGDSAHAPYIQGDLRWFVSNGGNLVSSANSVPYLNGKPALLQVSLAPTPAWDGVELQGTSLPGSSEIYLAACDWDIDTNSGVAESGSLGVVLSTWGLPSSGSFYLIDLLTGATSSVAASGGVVSIPWSPAAGEIDYFELIPATPLTLSVASNATVGEGSLTATLTATPSGGTTLYGPVAWTLGDGTTATGTTVVHTYSAPSGGSFTAQATVTDSSGARVSRSLTLTVLPRLALSLSPAFAWGEVGGAPVLLAAKPFGGQGPLSYVWAENGTTVVGASGMNLTLSANTSGNLSVSVLATDARGYSAAASSAVQVLPRLSVDLSGPTVVELPRTGTFTAGVSGGRSGSWNISWQVNSTSVAGAWGSSFAFPVPSWGAHAGRYRLAAVATDGLGGQATSNSLTVQVVPRLGVLVNPATSHVAVGTSFLLTAEASGGAPPLSYEWIEVAPLVQTVGSASTFKGNATAVGSIAYELVATDALGFRAYANATVVLAAPPVTPPAGTGPGGGPLQVLGPLTEWYLLGAAIGALLLGLLLWRRHRRRDRAQSDARPTLTGAGDQAPLWQEGAELGPEPPVSPGPPVPP